MEHLKFGIGEADSTDHLPYSVSHSTTSSNWAYYRNQEKRQSCYSLEKTLPPVPSCIFCCPT